MAWGLTLHLSHLFLSFRNLPDTGRQIPREAHNIHGDQAVGAEWRGHKIGYVPRIENHAIAQLLDRGEKLSARVAELKDSRNPWERVRFEVLLNG